MEEGKKVEASACKCPYCDADLELMEELLQFCKPCSITIITCAECGGMVREGAERCPECGAKL
jgi:hypothetical protein